MNQPARITHSGFVPLREVARASTNLVLFHHAGASASFFRSWIGDLDTDANVYAMQLPGREERRDEPPNSCFSDVVDSALPQFLDFSALPLVAFGHSLGASFAYEFLCRLQTQRPDSVASLIVSGRRAPHLERKREPVARLNDNAFLEKIRRYGGVPNQVLEDREMMAYFLPRLRNDFELSEATVFSQTQLTGTVLVLSGTDDPETGSGAIDKWSEVTTGQCRFTEFPGGHFFLNEHRDVLCDLINDLVQGHCTPTSRLTQQQNQILCQELDKLARIPTPRITPC